MAARNLGSTDGSFDAFAEKLAELLLCRIIPGIV